MPLGPKEMPWGMWKIEMIQSWAEIFLGFLQLDEYQVYQVNLEALSFKREFGWIALWFHDLYIGAAEHDRMTQGTSSGSPPRHGEVWNTLTPWDPCVKVFHLRIPKYGYWSFFLGVWYRQAKPEVFEDKNFTVVDTLETCVWRFWLNLLYIHVYSTIHWWHERSEEQLCLNESDWTPAV